MAVLALFIFSVSANALILLLPFVRSLAYCDRLGV